MRRLWVLGWALFAPLARAQGAPPQAGPAQDPPPAPTATAEPAPPPPPAVAPAPAPAPAPTYTPPPPGYVAPAYQQPPAGMYVAAAPPPKREQDETGYHLHDGFYLRMSLGAGWMRTRVESSLSGSSEVRVVGSGAGLDLLMGGTPTPGLVIGGGIFAVSASDPRVESGGTSRDVAGDASVTLFGPFVDGFFDSRGGFHLGGAIGISSFRIKPDDEQDDIDEKPFNGGGVALFTGYDAWISPDWSLGGYVRFVAASGKRDIDVSGQSTEEQAQSFGFSILFSALYH